MAPKSRRVPATSAAAKKPAPTANSRERLLDAGEKLFAKHGYDGVSLRSIADTAGVNVGIIPYFFGTKANLFEAVMLRRIDPVLRVRRARLQALLAKTDDMTIEAVVMALLEPLFQVGREHPTFLKLSGRSVMDPAPEVRKVMDKIYDPAVLLMPKAMRLLCSHLSPDEFYWRLSCLYGAMFYIQADTGRMQNIAGPQFDTSHPDDALPYIVSAFGAFFRTPPTDRSRR